MTKGKKAATAAAGVMLTAALAVSTVGGPTSSHSDSDYAGSITAIEEAVDNLVDKSVERGMDIEPPSESYTPGINGVIEGLDGMAPTNGTTRAVKVSKEGTLVRGDKVRACREFTAGTQIRFATGDVKVLATATDTEVGTSSGRTARIVVLFTQNGQTKLKTVDVNATGELSLGTTVVILEDEALTAADMTLDWSGRAYIAYNRDGDGVLTAVKCGADRVNELLWTDIWMDGGDPENICLAEDPYDWEAAVCCTRLPAGATEDSAREAVVLDMTLPQEGTEIADLGEEIVLTAAAQPALYGIDYSKDAYTKGWDIEYVHNWYNQPYSEVGCNVLFITYPTSDEYRHGIIHLRRDRAEAGKGAPAGPSVVEGYQMSQVYGSIPNVDMKRVKIGKNINLPVGVIMGHGSTRQFETESGQSTKSRLELELYTVARDQDKPVLIWWRPSDSWYNTNISNVTVGNLKAGTFFAAFARENTVYAALVDVKSDGTGVQGPLVNVGAFGTFAAVEEANASSAALVYDTAGGDGYVRLLDADQVVAEAKGLDVDGTALESGSTGEYISADMTYWLN